ncbi:uncharacterized protein LOC133195720 [Saccostrea echinata]|uniref:uncharacterized protein LOC133195720 n=1 Tax=Saccostrea echinata TaxID=191078 RepID=UPI002A82F381|nr:uncharacterized protein LOC133195720 [Saccostrea echinata]
MFSSINTTCPYTNWVPTAKELCADPNRYHCLNDEFGKSGWICADPIWVEAGRCPEFNSVAKKLDTVPCQGENCPDKVFQSSFVHLYLDCRRHGDEMTTSFTSMDLTTEAGALSSHASFGITVGVIAVVAVSIIAVAVLCFLLRKRRRNKNDSDPEAGIAMLATPEPNDERSFSRAQRALRTERFVVITGIQGAGKTFLAKRLCNEWLQEEKCVWITDPNSLPVVTDFDSVLILDDLFHELQSEDELKEIKANIESLYENAVVKDKGKIILTVTSLILQRHESIFEGRKYKNIINLDELSKVDREEILQFHMSMNNIAERNSKNQNSSIVIRDQDFKRMVEFNIHGSFESLVEKGIGYSAVIALCCKFYDKKELRDQCGRFVKTPMSWLRQYLRDMLNKRNIDRKMEAIALSVLALHGGKLTLRDLNSAMVDKLMGLENVNPNWKECLKQAFTNLKSKFVDENESVYSFQVPVVMKVLFIVICERHIELLQFSDKYLYQRRVCTSSSFPSDFKGDYKKSFLKHKPMS